MLLARLLILAGALHFTLLIAGAMMVRVLNWRTELRHVSALSRQIIWVHGAFVVIVILAFGALSIANAAALASGAMLARWVCGTISLFWLTRLMVQFFYFDAVPYLGRIVLKLGYHALTLLFAFFVAVYGWAAVLPIARSHP